MEDVAQQSGRLALDHDLRVEIRAGAEPPILVGRSGVAVGTRVKAASVRVEAPSKREIRALVPTENVSRLILVYFKRDLRGRLEQLPMMGLERILRIGDHAHRRIVPPLAFPCQDKIRKACHLID